MARLQGKKTELGTVATIVILVIVAIVIALAAWWYFAPASFTAFWATFGLR